MKDAKCFVHFSVSLNIHYFLATHYSLLMFEDHIYFDQGPSTV